MNAPSRTVTCRPAQMGDCTFLADIMLQSMLPSSPRGLFDDLADEVGVHRLEFHEALLRLDANHWGPLDSYLILERAGEPIGAGAAYPSSQPDNRPITPDGVKRLTAHFGLEGDRAKTFLRTYIMTFGAFGSLPHLVHPADYVLEYCALKPGTTGRVFGHLIRAHAERATAFGHRTLGLIALGGNEAAGAAWRSYGAELHSCIGPEAFKHKRPGLERYVMDLPLQDD